MHKSFQAWLSFEEAVVGQPIDGWVGKMTALVLPQWLLICYAGLMVLWWSKHVTLKQEKFRHWVDDELTSIVDQCIFDWQMHGR